MSEYNKLAKFYDKVMGKSDKSNEYIKSKIKKYNKNAKTVLELGCGTGSNLSALNPHYDTTGIDMSKEMLKIARRKIANGKFHLQDIRSFSFKKKFDVMLCLYDTINHLTLFNEWKKIFANAYEHLNEKGLFIFDVNTFYKLNCISIISPLVHKFDSDYLIIDVKKISASIFNWNLKVFERKNKNNFILHESNIKESGFEIKKISKELNRFFKIRNIEDENKKRLKSNSERIYFVCQKM